MSEEKKKYWIIESRVRIEKLKREDNRRFHEDIEKTAQTIMMFIQAGMYETAEAFLYIALDTYGTEADKKLINHGKETD